LGIWGLSSPIWVWVASFLKLIESVHQTIKELSYSIIEQVILVEYQAFKVALPVNISEIAGQVLHRLAGKVILAHIKMLDWVLLFSQHTQNLNKVVIIHATIDER
jgi:hypothetical protein